MIGQTEFVGKLNMRFEFGVRDDSNTFARVGRNMGLTFIDRWKNSREGVGYFWK